MEFLSVYNYRLSDRRGRENANADFLSRLPTPPTTEDISGSSALSDPDDLGVYLIRACGYTTPSCPIPGVGLGGLTPPSYNNPGTGPNPFPTPVLGGIHLTKDDCWTHRAPMPLRCMTGPTTSPFATSTDEPCLPYAIDDQHEASRSNCARHTRSRTATLAGNTPLRPDYRMAVRSRYAASAAPASPPKASFCSSPPPRSACLSSTIPLGRLTLPHPTPGSNSQMDNSPPAAPPVVQYPTPGNDNRAAAEQLSNTSLSYNNRDGDQAQRADPVCDATRRYIKLGYPNPPPLSLCDHLPSHTRPDFADIVDLAAKGHLLQGDDDATWERELDLQAFRRHILSYWATEPGQHQPHTRQYQQQRINAASREIARSKGERHLPGSYRLLTDDVYRARFLSATLPIGASIWYHSFDGFWWLGKVKQPSNDSGRYVIRFLDNPGPALIKLQESTYNTALHAPCGSWCLQTHGQSNPLQGVLHG